MQISEKTTERLILYKTILKELLAIGEEFIVSRELARLSNVDAALVRRDLMPLKCGANPVKGYIVKELIKKIDLKLNLNQKHNVAIIGLGRLGLSLLYYFSTHNTRFYIKAAFDIAPFKVNTRIMECEVYHIDELEKIIAEKQITLLLLTVPDKSVKGIEKLLDGTGIKGVLNFTQVPLKLSDNIIVNKVDIVLELEKLAFYCS